MAWGSTIVKNGYSRKKGGGLTGYGRKSFRYFETNSETNESLCKSLCRKTIRSYNKRRVSVVFA